MKVEYGFVGVKWRREVLDGAMTWANCFIEKGTCVLSASQFADRINVEGKSLRDAVIDIVTPGFWRQNITSFVSVVPCM